MMRTRIDDAAETVREALNCLPDEEYGWQNKRAALDCLAEILGENEALRDEVKVGWERSAALATKLAGRQKEIERLRADEPYSSTGPDGTIGTGPTYGGY